MTDQRFQREETRARTAQNAAGLDEPLLSSSVYTEQRDAQIDVNNEGHTIYIASIAIKCIASKSRTITSHLKPGTVAR